MVKNHLKRLNTPRTWDVLLKKNKFITRPNPGREQTLSIPLNTVLKELIGRTKTTKESKYLLRNKHVLINGNPRYDEKFPVGLLDVISLPKTDEHYRLLVNHKKKICIVEISRKEADVKLSKIMNKTEMKGGKTQINCSDGRNFLLNKNKEPELEKARTNDTVLYTLPDQKIKEVLRLEKNAMVYLYKGKHMGKVVKVDDFKQENVVFSLDGSEYETRKAYALVIGKNKPVITLTHTQEEQAEEAKSKQQEANKEKETREQDKEKPQEKDKKTDNEKDNKKNIKKGDKEKKD